MRYIMEVVKMRGPMMRKKADVSERLSAAVRRR
jgi:hypothetical protein